MGIAKRYVTIVGDKTARTTMGGSLLYLLYPRMVLGEVRMGGEVRLYHAGSEKEYLQKAVNMLPAEKIIIDSTSLRLRTRRRRLRG